MSAHAPILIVDDDWFFCRLVSETLETAGYRVRAVRNAKDAMLVLGREPLSLGIIDYRLGKTDGVALIEQIRGAGAQLPIIFLSGFSYDEKIFNHLRNVLQVSALMSKPIEPSSFISTVEQVLEGAAIHQSNGTSGEYPSEAVSSVRQHPDDAKPSRKMYSSARRSGGHQRFLWNEPIFCSEFYITGDSTVSEMERLAEFYEENLKLGLQLLDEDTYCRLCAWILFKTEQENNAAGVASDASDQASDASVRAKGACEHAGLPETDQSPSACETGNDIDAVPDLEEDTQPLDDLIHQLKAEYAAYLPQELMSVYRSIRKALVSRKDNDLDEAIFSAHRIRGTCGSYGFKDAAAIIEFLEEILRQPGERNSGWSESCLALVRTAMRMMRQDLLPDCIPMESKSHFLYVGDDDSLVRMLEQPGISGVTTAVTRARTFESTLTLTGLKSWTGVLIDCECVGIRNALNLVASCRNIPEMQAVGFALIADKENVVDNAQLLYSGISSSIVKPVTHSKLMKALEAMNDYREPMGRVLLIDSDASLIGRLSLALRRFGLLARVASSHVELMEAIDEFKPHLIIAGELLPELSGRELGLLLKVPERWKAIDVFVLVGPQCGDAVQYAEAALACDWLPRGSAVRDMAERIFDHLESSASFGARQDGRQAHAGSTVERLDSLIQKAAELEQPMAVAVIAPFELEGLKISIRHFLRLVEVLLSLRFRPDDLRANLDSAKFILACSGKTAFAVKEALKMFALEIEAMTASSAGKGARVLYAVTEYPASGSTPEALIDECLRQILESQAQVESTRLKR